MFLHNGCVTEAYKMHIFNMSLISHPYNNVVQSTGIRDTLNYILRKTCDDDPYLSLAYEN